MSNLPLNDRPLCSIIIPVYNEEDLIQGSIQELLASLSQLTVSYELIIVENGSKDKTCEIAQKLAQNNGQIRLFRLPNANYGAALRKGMEQAAGTNVVLFNIDLWDITFLRLGLALINDFDVVVASKALGRSVDNRPRIRRFLTFFFNVVLRWFFDFKGSDSHGMKVMNREKIIPVMERCQLDKGLFDTELMIRAERKQLRIVELPTTTEEKRVARDPILKKIIRVAGNLWRLKLAMWKDGGYY